MNVILFGQMSKNLANKIRNCGSHMSVDLLQQYSLGDLMNFSDEDGAMIIYIHVKRINNDSYNISLERVKRIIDYAAAAFNGISVFNLYSYEEQLLNETIGILPTVEKRILLNMNDQILDHCSEEYPSCFVKNNLDSLIWAIYDSYKRTERFKLFDDEAFEKQFCLSNNICDSKQGNSGTHPRNLKSPFEHLEKLPNVLCMFPRHQIVEFVLNAPMDIEELLKEQEAKIISELTASGSNRSGLTSLR